MMIHSILSKVATFLSRCFYKINVQDLEHIPPAPTPVIVIANHISYLDPVIVTGILSRNTHFLVDYEIYNWPIANYVFKAVGGIPIAPRFADAKILEKAFELSTKKLSEGKLIAIYPEGKITYTGDVNIFRSGVLEIYKRAPKNTVIIPIGINGLWGSWLSRSNGGALKGFWNSRKQSGFFFRRQVSVKIGKPFQLTSQQLQDSNQCCELLQKHVTNLMEPI
jgi:1-acyl-sn-glycerol-3-phosphate acyltransferase